MSRTKYELVRELTLVKLENQRLKAENMRYRRKGLWYRLYRWLAGIEFGIRA